MRPDLGNCHGAREPDRVRPIEQCRACAHWQATTGPRVYPLLRVVHVADGVEIHCGRRRPAEPEPEPV